MHSCLKITKLVDKMGKWMGTQMWNVKKYRSKLNTFYDFCCSLNWLFIYFPLFIFCQYRSSVHNPLTFRHTCICYLLLLFSTDSVSAWFAELNFFSFLQGDNHQVCTWGDMEVLSLWAWFILKENKNSKSTRKTTAKALGVPSQQTPALQWTVMKAPSCRVTI